MVYKSQWEWRLTIIGIVSLAAGIIWLIVWRHGLEGPNSVDWITSELHAPLAARLMVVVGILLLIAAGIKTLVRKLTKGSQVG